MDTTVTEDLALGAFRLVKEALGLELDFTPETLPLLDHFLGTLPKDNHTIEFVAPCAGAYFGEVVVRSLAESGFRWYAPADDYKDWRLEGERVFICFNPIGTVLESLFREPAAGWNSHVTLLPEHRTLVEQSLEATGPVREDDYYRLAIRFEVLEQTVRLLEELEGGGHRLISSEAYASVLGHRAASTDA